MTHCSAKHGEIHSPVEFEASRYSQVSSSFSSSALPGTRVTLQVALVVRKKVTVPTDVESRSANSARVNSATTLTLFMGLETPSITAAECQIRKIWSAFQPK